MSDEESDDEHDENEKNKFEDIEEAAYFLNPFGKSTMKTWMKSQDKWMD